MRRIKLRLYKGEVALPDAEYVPHSDHESEASSDMASVHDSESESTIHDSESESKSEKKTTILLIKRSLLLDDLCQWFLRV